MDPLFKKTCADFDEGGARGLLLNHLSMSDQGMIVFDAGDALATAEDLDEPQVINAKMDLFKLKAKFSYYLQDLFHRELCPSLHSFEFNAGVTDLKLDLFDKPDLFAVDDGDVFEGYDDMAMDYGPEPVDDLSDHDEDVPMVEADYANHRKVILSMKNDGPDDDIFSYFESGMMKNWAGPEHWKLRPLKGTQFS